MLSRVRHWIVIMVDASVLIHVIVVRVTLRVIEIEKIRSRFTFYLRFLALMILDVFIVSFRVIVHDRNRS